MYMKYIFKGMEVFRRLTLSYGQVFIMISAMMGTGIEALKATYTQLQEEKYKPIRTHFEKGVMLIYAAIAEFKTGFFELKKAIDENPEDFKGGLIFMKQLKEEYPKALEDCFRIPNEMAAELKKEFDSDTELTRRLPEFIRSSGEYMDCVNVGKREVNEEEFKAALFKQYSSSPFQMVHVLKAIKSSIEVKGWASMTFEGSVIILWADAFEMDLPADTAAVMFCDTKWPYKEKIYKPNRSSGASTAAEKCPEPKPLPGHIENDAMVFLPETVDDPTPGIPVKDDDTSRP